MMKGCKSDGDGTFSGTCGNDGDAPKAVHQGDRETFWSRFLNSLARRGRFQAAKNKPLIFRQ
jgi:hypothetical protein